VVGKTGDSVGLQGSSKTTAQGSSLTTDGLVTGRDRLDNRWVSNWAG